MAQKVEIEVVATDSASTKLSNIANVVTGISSAINIAQNMFGTMQRVMDATVNVAQDYNQQVRDMMLATGGTAEETSKLVQVIDDVGISYDTLKTAMKMASKEGIEPNLESIAALADQYNKLAPGVERNKFLMDNFGRSGLDMARAMEAGGEALRQMASEMDGGLILTKDNIAASEEYRKSLDELGDTWQSLQVTLGNKSIPLLNDILDIVMVDVTAINDLTSSFGELANIINYTEPGLERVNALWTWLQNLSVNAMNSVNGATDAMNSNTDAVNANKDAIDASIPSMEAQNVAMQNALQNATWLTENQKTYNEELASLQSQRANEVATLEELTKRYGPYNGKLDEHKQKIGELDDKIKQLQDTQKKQTDEWILKMMEQQGATVEMQVAYAEAAGIIDERSMAAVTAIDSVNQQLKDGKIDAQQYRDMVAKLIARIQSLDGLEAYADIYVTEHGGLSSRNFHDAINIAAQTNPGRTYTLGTGRASGGPVEAGTMYPVGERGMEMFVPTQNGTIIPNHKLGQMGGSTIILNYSPMFSTANRSEFLQNITPMLDDWYRRRLSS